MAAALDVISINRNLETKHSIETIHHRY